MTHAPIKFLLQLFALLLAFTEVSQAGLLDRWRERRTEQQGSASTSLPPGGLQHLQNIAYGSDPAQVFDVYLPAEAHGAPVIFMVHGGAWTIGDKAAGRVVDAKVARWVSRGFIFVSTNYRMLPDAAPDVQLRDIARALAAARGKAAEWGGDPRRFILMGHSAGAHLVALLNARPPADSAGDLQGVLGTVSLDSAAMDLVEIMNRKHYRFYDKAFGSDPDYWRRMSPTLTLSAGAKPLLAVCSSRRDDSCPQARQLAERAAQLGVRAEVLSKDMSHGEINSQLGQDSAYTRDVETFMASLDGEIARRLQ